MENRGVSLPNFMYKRAKTIKITIFHLPFGQQIFPFEQKLWAFG